MKQPKRCKLKDKFQAQDSLPEDLLVEVLQRLPVRSLLRFQCVSRSWQSLITDSSFRLHSMSAGSYSIFCHRLCGDPDDPDDQFYRLKFERSETDDDDDVIDHLRIQLHKFDVYKALGSSNGLIGYADFVNYGSDHFLVCLWNPSINRYKKLKTAIDLVNQCPVHSGQALGAFGILDLHGLVLRNWQVPLETSFERHAREGVTEAHIAGFDFSLSAG